MNKLSRFLLTFAKALAFVLLTIPVFAQNLADTEKDLVDTYARISSFYREDSDSLAYYSRQFDQKIAAYLEKYPATFKHPFTQLKKECFITTSADGLFRVYSWDTWLGGTAPDFSGLAQFQSGTSIFLEQFGGMGFFPEVYTVKTPQKTYYIAVCHSIFSTADAGESLRAYTIEQNELRQVELFKMKGKMTTRISFEFDFYSVVGRPERPLKLIKYDEKKKTISVPVIAENGAVTEIFTVYRFNGKYFEEVGRK